ncbi:MULTISPECIES: monovalent cation/H(+) antiporter subunit G [unclassified Fusibacter]|uniref:monovalent cation/H(+) antiporter subunit G n=1 Tax=unclassified Fusibacter TaxID=2624464 RepID=UPI0010115863|nr:MULTISPECIES: monovalent cation/H(+) antiporter subunit G [unclassified Fusibacter]MCK8060062.1 monovalent cation/H(+) antiporter subunit G [Fusibacter sp. A2]NPE22204.1 monovalent cation/H(+) antiporter subunit G [Fusibacter sp. A1]RXV60980.1 monovalent cation/H(+) antiporter subunit G [Fusibacter sp. A1]
MTVVGWIFVVIGGLFYGVGGLGLYRMPDIFNRAQAGTKATTLGTLSTAFGMLLIHPEWWARLLLILVFIAVTNPIGSSTLIRNAYKSGVKPIEGTDTSVVDSIYGEVEA